MSTLWFPSGEIETGRGRSPMLADLKQVVVIYSVIEAWTRGEAHEFVADMDSASIARAITDGLREVGYWAEIVSVRTLDDLATKLAEFDPRSTLIFNLCEAFGGTSEGEARVTSRLEELSFYFVGASTVNLVACLDKHTTKARLLQYGIPTAPYQTFVTGREAICVPLPAMVKPIREDCSVGLSENSIVHTPEALRSQVRYVLDVYHQPALVEMFLEGREFTVSLWDDGTTKILAVAEADYSDAPDPARVFYDFEAKWGDNGYPTICPAQLDTRLERAIRRSAFDAYTLMGCRDYTRVDMREKDGQVYVLEVNPNPSLAPGAGFAKAADVAGYSYAQMAQHLVCTAWCRKTRKG